MDNAPVATRLQNHNPGDTTRRRCAGEAGRARCAQCQETFPLDFGVVITSAYCLNRCLAFPKTPELIKEHESFCDWCRGNLRGRALCGYCEAVILGPPLA